MKPIWHLFYKEWIKTRTAFFCSLLVGVGVVFYIFIGVENKITLMGAKNYTLNILYSNPPVIYYSLLRYLPLLAAVSIGISQYVPDCCSSRFSMRSFSDFSSGKTVSFFRPKLPYRYVIPYGVGFSPGTGYTTISPLQRLNPTVCANYFIR